MPTASSWSTQQLTEFLAAITAAPDEASVVTAAVERAAEALECEIGALVVDGSVVAAVGFPAGSVPEGELIEAATGCRSSLALETGEVAHVIPTRLDDPESGRIVLARAASDGVRPEEVILLNGMIRVLGMTLTTIRTVESLRQRQRLLEKNAAIQRAIAVRAPLQEVLDLITRSACEFLDADVVAMRMVESDNPRRTRIVASSGFHAQLLSAIEQGAIDEGIAGQAIADDRVVSVANYVDLPAARPELVELGIRSGLATPIHDRGTPIGALVIGSRVAGRTYSAAEQETLATFAQHASLALLDARTVDELLRQALHDPLTTLANRALFLDRLEHALARAERNHSSVGVLFIDIDRFKGVNDTLGHAAGDELLIEVGNRLEGLFRTSDTVARFGGDEFAVLLEDVDDRATVERLTASAVELLRRPFSIGADEVSVTASVGVALAGRAIDDPLRDADLALYRAKSDGKNRHEFFVEEMRVAMRTRLKLEAALERAVDGEEFVLYHQPIVDLDSGAILGMEALIRWQQDGSALLPPDEFIPLAEDTGAILAIGHWVLREACTRAAAWPTRASGRGPFVSVNIAPIQLIQIDLAWAVDEILASTRLDPSRLVLEITETSLLDDTTALRKLCALRKLGVRLAVDDFGTGYSSLHYLQRFPVDMLKIAKPFIDELSTHSGRGTLAQAIIDLGRTFNLEVIAEGIEKTEHVDRLRQLGCSTGQGFLLSHPLDPDATEALMRDPFVPLPTPDAVGATSTEGPVPAWRADLAWAPGRLG